MANLGVSIADLRGFVSLETCLESINSPGHVSRLNIGFRRRNMDSGNTYSGCWLVHDSDDIQTGNGSGILRSLSLIVVEVGWNCNDGVDDLAMF